MQRLSQLRRLATSAAIQQQSTASPGAQMEIFDGLLKAAHRGRAALAPAEPDPLADEVASRLVERMEDCTRAFPKALIVGGAGIHMLRMLRGGRGGVECATVVDSSQGMLERARRTWEEERKGGLEAAVKEAEFLLADPARELLPVEPGQYDVVFSCLGLHWVNDAPGMVAQCRFALRPDGLFLGAMLGGTTLQELRIACTLAQQEREGGVSPRTSPLVQVRDAGNLMTRAGLAIPTVDLDDITVHYPDVLGLVSHLRSMAESNALLQRREMLPRDTALAAAAAYTALFGGEDEGGSVPATYQVVYMTGWAPDPTQRKAAKRGSATMSFKDISDAAGKETDGRGAEIDEGQKPAA